MSSRVQCRQVQSGVGRNSDQPLAVFGVNHHDSAVALREELVRELADPYRRIAEFQIEDLSEYLVLSTCNRFEVIAAGSDSALNQLFERLSVLAEECARRVGWSSAGSRGCSPLLAFRNREGVAHIFRVAAGLDSLVLGEPQILGQLKAAYRSAVEQGVVGPVLHRLLQTTFGVAKKIRSHTAVGERGVSVSYVAVELAKQIVGDLDRASVLVLGSGEVAELAALHLKGQGCSQITVANRTLERAVALAEQVGGRAIELDQCWSAIGSVDIVIGSLLIDRPILPVSEVKKLRRQRPLFLIDLGVPRNFAEALGEIDGVYLYNLDDLSSVAARNQELRVEARCDAELIVEYGVLQFQRWLTRLGQSDHLLDARERLAESCKRELERVLSGSGSEGERNPEQLSRSAEQLTSVLFHELLRISGLVGLSADAAGLDLGGPDLGDSDRDGCGFLQESLGSSLLVGNGPKSN